MWATRTNSSSRTRLSRCLCAEPEPLFSNDNEYWRRLAKIHTETDLCVLDELLSCLPEACFSPFRCSLERKTARKRSTASTFPTPLCRLARFGWVVRHVTGFRQLSGRASCDQDRSTTCPMTTLW